MFVLLRIFKYVHYVEKHITIEYTYIMRIITYLMILLIITKLKEKKPFPFERLHIFFAVPN